MSLSWLDRDLTTVAYIWRLERDDGVALGFVSHDRDLIVNDFIYRAAPGMVPSTIAMSDSLDIDSLEIEGVLSNDAITESDIKSGRWNGARLQISLANWEQPQEEIFPLLTGEFGEITQSGDAFRVEILGSTSHLDEAIAPLTSPTCRARFGDAMCKLSLHAHQREVRLSAVADDRLEFAELAGTAENYVFGELRWLGGTNCGLAFAILKGAGNSLWLTDNPPYPLAIGEPVLLTSGCDKNFSTCRDRFGNSINFRGEPFLPGNDLLTRYRGS